MVQKGRESYEQYLQQRSSGTTSSSHPSPVPTICEEKVGRPQLIVKQHGHLNFAIIPSDETPELSKPISVVSLVLRSIYSEHAYYNGNHKY